MVLPHSSFGDPHCCGCLDGIVRDEQADVICNECHTVVRTVAAEDLHRLLDQMELTLDVATAECPECGAVSLVPGFSKLLFFTCHECGDVVEPG